MTGNYAAVSGGEVGAGGGVVHVLWRIYDNHQSRLTTLGQVPPPLPQFWSLDITLPPGYPHARFVWTLTIPRRLPPFVDILLVCVDVGLRLRCLCCLDCPVARFAGCDVLAAYATRLLPRLQPRLLP